MRPRHPRLLLTLMLAAAVCALLATAPAGSAAAQGLQWRLEQPAPPALPSGEGSQTPIGLGRIGDIEFWAPNRGVLITAGNGSTVPAGVWAYNGVGWHELADVCGASDGRIAWAGPDEFWTVSDGRPGQATNGLGQPPPLEDDTLCHFAGGAVAGSYATLGFRSNSYQAMDAAACVSASDCWFAGAPLPEPQPGSFHLHWNGSAVEAEPNSKAHSIEAMRVFDGHLYESIGLASSSGEEVLEEEEIEHPYVLGEVAPEHSAAPFTSLHQFSLQSRILPEYASGSFPQALAPLQLSADSEELWAAAGPAHEPPSGSLPGELTVLRDTAGSWTQVLGPADQETLQVDPAGLEDASVSSIAAEPGGSSAWLAPDSQGDLTNPDPTQPATVVHIASSGAVAEEQLPDEEERSAGVGPKGAAFKVVCPAQNDCWMATTQGWLFHLSEEATRTLAPDTDPDFNGPLITSRPEDEGLPQIPSDAPPVDSSGLPEQAPTVTKVEEPETSRFATVTVPLLSHLRSRLIHGTTLELSFHLAVKARVRLIAKRKKRVVARTAMRVLKAGKRSLLLRLNVHSWPTKLDLQTHALAPLPKVSTQGAGVESVSTGLRPYLGGLGSAPFAGLLGPSL